MLNKVAQRRAFKQLPRQFKRTFVDRIESWLGVDRFNRMSKLPTKYMFAIDHAEKRLNPRITVDSAEFAAMKKVLKPGDIILAGNDDSFVHGMVHVGKGDVVHALAQEAPGRRRNLFDWLFDRMSGLSRWLPLPRSWREGLSMRFKALPRSSTEGIGVVHETLDTYFARAHRDNVLVMRLPGLTAKDLKGMRRFALAQAGKKYDYSFATFDDGRLYCTELVAKALGQVGKPPRIQHARIGGRLIKREVVRTDEIVRSPDLVPIWKAAAYDNTPFGQAHPVKIGR